MFTSAYMGRDRISLRATTEREKRLGAARDATGIDSDAELVDAALEHLAESVENFEAAKEDLTPKQAELLSTSVVRLTMYPQVRTD